MRTTIFVIELCSILFCCTSLVASEKDKDRTFIHFIMNGQSLSTGHQSYPVISTEHFKGNYMLGNQVWINYGNTGELKLNHWWELFPRLLPMRSISRAGELAL